MSSILQSAQTTLQEDFGGFGHNAAGEEHQFDIDHVPDQTGKVAVVTGGSEGIGYGCTRTLLSKNISKLYILSVSQDVVNGAYDALKKDMGEDKANRAKWMLCDLSDWKQTAQMASEIAKSTERIDVVINNAARGIMTHQLTDYGVDRHMAVNHMGHVVLTSHLLPVLKKTASQGNKVRIVNLASNAIEMVPKNINYDSLESINTDEGPMPTYGRSKLANLLYARYLARHLTKEHPNILANGTHPGFVDTKLTNEMIHEPYPRKFLPTTQAQSCANISPSRWLRYVRRLEALHERSVEGLRFHNVGCDLHRQERRVYLPACDAGAW